MATKKKEVEKPNEAEEIAKAEAAEAEKPVEKKRTAYLIDSGSIIVGRKVKNKGDEVTAEMLPGGKAELDLLIGRKVIKKCQVLEK